MRNTKVEQFWQWFRENSERIAAYESDQLLISNEVGLQLRRIHQPEGYTGGGPALTFEIGGKGKIREFIISTGGIKSAFHLARKLATTAPEIPGWKISALVPRKNLGRMLVEYQLGESDVWFKADPVDGKINVTLFVKNLPDEKEHDVVETRHFLMDVLGEEAFANRIGVFDCQRLPSNPASWNLRPIRELTEVVDKIGFATPQ